MFCVKRRKGKVKKRGIEQGISPSNKNGLLATEQFIWGGDVNYSQGEEKTFKEGRKNCESEAKNRGGCR